MYRYSVLQYTVKHNPGHLGARAHLPVPCTQLRWYVACVCDPELLSTQLLLVRSNFLSWQGFRWSLTHLLVVLETVWTLVVQGLLVTAAWW